MEGEDQQRPERDAVGRVGVRESFKPGDREQWPQGSHVLWRGEPWRREESWGPRPVLGWTLGLP